MIIVRSRLITGLIKRIIKSVLKVLYRIIKLFSLQLPILIGIIGLILHLFGVMKDGSALYAMYIVVFIVSLLTAVYKTVKKFLYGGKKNKRSSVQIVGQKNSRETVQEETAIKREQNYEEEAVNEKTVPTDYETKNTEYPKYYTVNQNPDYVMAEYADKYELYYRSKTGLKRVRTDYKKGVN